MWWKRFNGQSKNFDSSDCILPPGDNLSKKRKTVSPIKQLDGNVDTEDSFGLCDILESAEVEGSIASDKKCFSPEKVRPPETTQNNQNAVNSFGYPMAGLFIKPIYSLCMTLSCSLCTLHEKTKPLKYVCAPGKCKAVHWHERSELCNPEELFVIKQTEEPE